MHITVVAIGKKHDPRLVKAIEDYSSRLTHYTKLKWKLLDTKITPTMSQEQIRMTESALIASSYQANDIVILLDERGKEFDSLALANHLQSYMNSGAKNIIFIIGGAYGVDQEIAQRANLTWSLSRLVFPHQLVRLILVEQLYRAHTILAGEKYHHA